MANSLSCYVLSIIQIDILVLFLVRIRTNYCMTTYPLLVWQPHLVIRSYPLSSTSITPIDILVLISVRIHTNYGKATYPLLVWLTHLVFNSDTTFSTPITPIDIL